MTTPLINILVTGASGALGTLIVQHLLKAKSDKIHIIAASRSIDKLQQFASQGAELRYLDFDDKISVDKAFVGVHRAILISTEDIGRRHVQHKTAIIAAEDAGVQHLLYTSLTSPFPTVPLWKDHFWTEVYLASSKLNWTILRNQVYAEVMISNSAPTAVATGTLYSASGNSKRGYVARDDCALAAATILLNTEGHDKAIHDITGPEALSNDEVAALLSEVAGKPVKHVNLPFDEYNAIAKKEFPAFFHPIVYTYENLAVEGYSQLVTSAFFKITGRQPTPFKVVLEANKG